MGRSRGHTFLNGRRAYCRRGLCPAGRGREGEGIHSMSKALKVAAAAVRVSGLALPVHAQLESVGEGEGRGRYRRLGRLYRARRDRQELRLGHRFRGQDRLQGRHVKTAATSDEMVALMNEGGFDLVTALGRRQPPADRRQDRAAGQCRPDPELGHGRSAPPGRAVAHGRRRPLRRPLPVGLERADVQHRGLQGRPRQAGTSSSRRWTCPTASPMRAASRPSTGRSTSPTPRSTSRPTSPNSASRTPMS